MGRPTFTTGGSVLNHDVHEVSLAVSPTDQRPGALPMEDCRPASVERIAGTFQRDRIRAFVAGYHRVRPLTDWAARAIPLYLVGRGLQMLYEWSDSGATVPAAALANPKDAFLAPSERAGTLPVHDPRVCPPAGTPQPCRRWAVRR